MNQYEHPKPNEIKDLQQQIQRDQERPSRPAEKPLKIDESFDSVVKKMSEKPPFKNTD